MSGLIKTHADNLFISNNWLADAQHGWVKGWDASSKQGVNEAVGTAFEDLWGAGATMTWLIAAATLEAISSSADDTAAGTGARTIIVEGLDENWEFISETITMNGTSASTATTAEFLRVNKAYVATVGAYGGVNAGNITIRVSSAGATQSYIIADYGYCRCIHISTPANKEIDIHEVHISSDSTKEADFRLQVRENADDSSVPCSSWHTRAYYGKLTGFNDISFLVPINLPAKTDFRIQAKSQSGTLFATAEIKYSMHDIPLE